MICEGCGVEQEGMPDPAVLNLLVSDGQCLMTFGRALVYRYDVDDLGMRTLASVALTDAKQSEITLRQCSG